MMGSAGRLVLLLLSAFSYSTARNVDTRQTEGQQRLHYAHHTAPSRVYADFNYQALPSQPVTEVLTNLPNVPEYGKREAHDNVKTIVVTKRVPVPYQIHPIRAPIRRPHAVMVPKPYVLQLTKPHPYLMKVPVPQHVSFTYKMPADKPHQIKVGKPQPVYLEQKGPFNLKFPLGRPIPVHFPVEKPLSYTVEKLVPYTGQDGHLFENAVTFPDEKPVFVQKPQEAEVFQFNFGGGPENLQAKPVASNVRQNVYVSHNSPVLHPHASAVISHEQYDMPTGSRKQPYPLDGTQMGTIHVTPSPKQNWREGSNEWVPKDRRVVNNPPNYEPVQKNQYTYVLQENGENPENFVPSLTASVRGTHGIQFETVQYGVQNQEASRNGYKRNQFQTLENKNVNYHGHSNGGKRGDRNGVHTLKVQGRHEMASGQIGHFPVTNGIQALGSEQSPSFSLDQFSGSIPDVQYVSNDYNTQFDLQEPSPYYGNQHGSQIAQVAAPDLARQYFQGEDINYVPLPQAVYAPQGAAPNQETHYEPVITQQRVLPSSKRYPSAQKFTADDAKHREQNVRGQRRPQQDNIGGRTEYHLLVPKHVDIDDQPVIHHEQVTTVEQQTTLPATTQRLQPTGPSIPSAPNPTGQPLENPNYDPSITTPNAFNSRNLTKKGRKKGAKKKLAHNQLQPELNLTAPQDPRTQ